MYNRIYVNICKYMSGWRPPKEINFAWTQHSNSFSDQPFQQLRQRKSHEFLRMKEVRAQKANVRTFCFEGKGCSVLVLGVQICKGWNFIEENLSIAAAVFLKRKNRGAILGKMIQVTLGLSLVSCPFGGLAPSHQITTADSGDDSFVPNYFLEILEKTPKLQDAVPWSVILGNDLGPIYFPTNVGERFAPESSKSQGRSDSPWLGGKGESWFTCWQPEIRDQFTEVGIRLSQYLVFTGCQVFLDHIPGGPDFWNINSTTQWRVRNVRYGRLERIFWVCYTVCSKPDLLFFDS